MTCHLSKSPQNSSLLVAMWSRQFKFILLLVVLRTVAWKLHIEARPPPVLRDHVTGSLHVNWATAQQQQVGGGGGRMPGEGEEEEAYAGGVGTLGSRPPSCTRKCGGCVPCSAIQVPTIAGRLRTHYANYEPEGWKCKCGSSIYNP